MLSVAGHLPLTEVLCALRSLCSSRTFDVFPWLGTGSGDGFSARVRWPRAIRGNKKGHLLAFPEAL